MCGYICTKTPLTCTNPPCIGHTFVWEKLLKLCHGDCPSFMWPTWMLRPIRAPFQDLVLFSGFCTSLHFSFLCFFLLHQPAATLWLKSSVGPLYCPVCERHALLLISSSNLCTWNPCPPPTDIFLLSVT